MLLQRKLKGLDEKLLQDLILEDMWFEILNTLGNTPVGNDHSAMFHKHSSKICLWLETLCIALHAMLLPSL